MVGGRTVKSLAKQGRHRSTLIASRSSAKLGFDAVEAAHNHDVAELNFFDQELLHSNMERPVVIRAADHQGTKPHGETVSHRLWTSNTPFDSECSSSVSPNGVK